MSNKKMIDDRFKQSFSELNIVEKRNHNELIYIASLVQIKEQQLKLPSVLRVKNYDVNRQAQITENEMLDFLYEDIYCIKRELITILTAENK